MKRIIALFILAALVVACSSVPITGRKQFTILPESQMVSMSLTQYDQFLNENNVVPMTDQRAQMIARCGEKISKSVEQYMKDHGMGKAADNFVWEFNLVNDPTVNAWCMPGGKVVFYTGILDVCEDEAGVAVVMGHEVAHAVARHGNERMSTSLAAQLGTTAASVWLNENPKAGGDLLMQSIGAGTQLGMLSFSRNHETEADKMGLVFMAMAGYDPREAPDFWERMAAQSGGSQPPEFMSTHPSHDRRVSDLNDYMPEALKYYNKN